MFNSNRAKSGHYLRGNAGWLQEYIYDAIDRARRSDREIALKQKIEPYRRYDLLGAEIFRWWSVDAVVALSSLANADKTHIGRPGSIEIRSMTRFGLHPAVRSMILAQVVTTTLL